MVGSQTAAAVSARGLNPEHGEQFGFELGVAEALARQMDEIEKRGFEAVAEFSKHTAACPFVFWSPAYRGARGP